MQLLQQRCGPNQTPEKNQPRPEVVFLQSLFLSTDAFNRLQLLDIKKTTITVPRKYSN